ncbi:MAG: aquaporin family protein [Planctomycetes bacterium]|nr:aquaporin family protein [Planctomycetota bacterium]
MFHTLRQNWPEYLSEAVLLGLFMLSASSFGLLLEHPGSPVRAALGEPFARRALMGVAMGLTAIALIYSPLGKRSGAHMNPAVTLTYLHLGKVRARDASCYVAAQFMGGAAGMGLATLVFGRLLAEPSVNYVVTQPGARGVAPAFLAEFAISLVLMSVVLRVSSSPRIANYTGLFAGALVALYITFEAPLSGMSMNPARSFGSAFCASSWMDFWVYLTAPLLGMGAAALLYTRSRRMPPVHCAKLHHDNPYRCIFCGADAAPPRGLTS